MARPKITYLFITIIAIALMLLCASCDKGKNSEKDEVYIPTLPDSINNLGTKEWEIGNYRQALEHFSIVYKKYKKDNNEEQMANVLNNIGLVNWSLRNNDEAMECYNEAAQIAEKLGMKRLLGLTYTNRALIYKQTYNFKPAFEHNNKAIALFKQLDNPKDLAIAYNNQGQLYRYSEKPDEALTYYRLSLEECKKNNYTQGLATAWQNIANVYSEKGNSTKAFEAARKCLNYSLESKSKVRINEAYHSLSLSHERFARPDSALYYYKKHHEVEKDMMLDNQSERLSQNQADLNVEVKNLRIKNLQNEKEIADNRLLTIAFGILAALLIATFFIYGYFSRMHFKKRQLEAELYNSRKILAIKEQELKTYIIDLSAKNAIIQSLQEENHIQEPTPEEVTDDEIAELLEQKILTDDNWEAFKIRFKAIYPAFFTDLKESGIALTEAETRLLVLMRLELNSKDMGNILGISPQSVRVCKMRLKKKLPSDKYCTVEDFLAKLTQ